MIGTGVIGASWASLFLSRELDITAYDPAPDAETSPRRQADALWPGMLMQNPAADAFPNRLRFLPTAVAAAGLVQANDSERIAMKQGLFAAMDAVAPADTIWASSSSTLLGSDVQAVCATLAGWCLATRSNRRT